MQFGECRITETLVILPGSQQAYAYDTLFVGCSRPTTVNGDDNDLHRGNTLLLRLLDADFLFVSPLSQRKFTPLAHIMYFVSDWARGSSTAWAVDVLLNFYLFQAELDSVVVLRNGPHFNARAYLDHRMDERMYADGTVDPYWLYWVALKDQRPLFFEKL